MVTESWRGTVFDDSLEGRSAPAQVSIGASSVHATTDGGDTFELPFASLRIERGGATGRMTFCRSPDGKTTIACDAPALFAALQAIGSKHVREQVDALRARERSRRVLGITLGAGAIGLVVLLIAVLPAIFSSLVGAAVGAVPFAVDEKIGELAIESMNLGGKKLEEGELPRDLRAITSRLAPHAGADIDFDVHAVESPTVNAFALPGGQIVVYTGLIEQAADPEQVAGVIAHEMAHVTHRHGIRRIAESLGIIGALQLVFGDATGLLAAAHEVLTIATINSYGRDQELQADRTAVATLHAAGLDPRALMDFFSSDEKGPSDVPALMAWLSTHPDHEARVHAMREQLEELPKVPQQDLPVDWSHLKKKADAPAQTE